MKDLVIFGTGGLGRGAHQIARDMDRDRDRERRIWRLLGFLDENRALHGTEVHGLPVLGGIGWHAAHPGAAIVVAIANPAARRRIVLEIARAAPVEFATLVHPRAWLNERVTVGSGSIVAAGVVTSADIAIGNHVIFNMNCSIGHDATIEDFVTVAPAANISGRVRIGQGCDLGTNCCVIQGLTIGRWSVIGAGAVVIAGIPPNTTAVGVPARPIKARPEGWYEPVPGPGGEACRETGSRGDAPCASRSL